jgi:hypothetical protein
MDDTETEYREPKSEWKELMFHYNDKLYRSQRIHAGMAALAALETVWFYTQGRPVGCGMMAFATAYCLFRHYEER